jgi:hypothetical protein
MAGEGIKAPTCRVCGDDHWGNMPHKWGKGEPSEPASKDRKTVLVDPPKPVPPLNLLAEIAALKVRVDRLEAIVADVSPPTMPPPPDDAAFDKKAYQRELMRKRRAEKDAPTT